MSQREMPLYCPSWQKVSVERKATIVTKIGIAFWIDPRNQARAAQNLQNQANSTVVCRQGSWSLARLRDQMMESSATREYPSLIHTFFMTHTVGGVFTRDEDRAIYITSSSWSFVLAILGQMTYLVADSTPNCARSFLKILILFLFFGDSNSFGRKNSRESDGDLIVGGEDDVVVPIDKIQLDDKLHMIEKPVEVMDREISFWSDPKNVAWCAQNARNRAKSTVICRQGSRSLVVLRDRQMESSATREYQSLIQTYFDTQTVDGVFLRDKDRLLYEEILKLQVLGTYIDDQMMTIVHRGKQRGHILGVGRVLARRGRDVLVESGAGEDDESGDHEDADEDEEDDDS
nr:hypothetical protein [Tanacetum cinerariifolium]